MENLLAGNKNIGTTHITNGCYRLHPVEWNIGEAAGALAGYAIRTGDPPRAVRNDAKLLADFQQLLIDTLGFQLGWPDDIRTTRR
ncbi:FAD-dependent oxidoreductase [Microlunatus sp. Gsoil 973]|uniref:FAD-dependent oxidoreductase n=1 Tax=Microlunatus sp. Gsoil 973 TaxID=2672569 RepID=UPI002106933A|nr:FAD-dependent oxidoreductase [Microlunatus sp. Gsoil 973]